MLAFISGALTSASGKVRLEVFYEKIGQLCEKSQIKAFIPHRDANKEMLEFTPSELYKTNMETIRKADLLIAYAGQPSIGAGMEIQRACSLGIDVIILSEQNLYVSMPLQGCPAIIKHIVFKDFDDALKQLEECINKWILRQENGTGRLVREI